MQRSSELKWIEENLVNSDGYKDISFHKMAIRRIYSAYGQSM